MSERSGITAASRSYNVHGMSLHVKAEDSSLISHVDAILSPFALPAIRSGGFVLTLAYAKPGQIDQSEYSLDLIWQGLLPAGLPASCYAGKDIQQICLPGRARVHIDSANRQAKISVVPGSEKCLDHGCITPVLGEFLGQVDQHILHAASLSIEHAGRLRAVSLMGPSGSGKTTAALVLAQAGMNLMADDVSFVGPANGESSRNLAIWGLPRPCKVHKNTLAMLPYLSVLPRCPSLREDKDFINITEISSPYVCTSVEPALILFLTDRNEDEHRVQPIDQVASLTELTRHNLRAGHCSLYSRAAKAFAMLGQLAAKTRSCSLSIGPDLDSLPRMVHSLLEA